MIEIFSKEDSEFFSIASCITYKDILFKELHDINVQTGNLVKINYSDGIGEVVKITEIEHGDGTIWVKIQ